MIKKSLLLLTLITVHQSSSMDKAITPLRTLHKMESYLNRHNLTEEYNETKKSMVRTTLNNFFCLENQKEAASFHYGLWKYPKESAQLLNSKKLNCSVPALCATLKMKASEDAQKKSPKKWLEFVSRSTDSWNTVFVPVSHALELYGITKFVGQYTDNPSDFINCVNAVEAITIPSNSALLPTRDALILMYRNPLYGHVTLRDAFLLMSENPWYGHPTFLTNYNLHKKNAFNRSIYILNPAYNAEAPEFKIELYKNLIRHDTKVSGIFLIQELLNNTIVLPETTIEEFFSEEANDIITHHGGSESYMADLKKLATEIIDDIHQQPAETFVEMNQRINNSALQILEGITVNDICEIHTIIDRAMIYGENKTLESHCINRAAFYNLFTLGIVSSTSDFAYYSMRQATKHGCRWALHFLIEQGVTLNPPRYSSNHPFYSDSLFRKSLVDIALDNGDTLLANFLDNHNINSLKNNSKE